MKRAELPDTQSMRIPSTFVEYVRSFGPGIVVVLTWLGAGDIVEVGTAGGNYGYSLIWVMVVAIFMRFLFVSLVAKYQLCNERGEGVLDGLARLHWGYAPLLFVAAIVMGHVYGSYMTVGIAEASVNLTGVGQKWMWALFWNSLAVAFVFKPSFARIELLFNVFLAMLAISFLGSALWVGPNLGGVLKGLVSFELPEQQGPYDAMLITIGMIGAVGGSLMNLIYPYFLTDKGWCRPEHRRVQTYDFLLGVMVMILLDLAIWTLGAELLHPRGLQVKEMDDLPRLLSEVLGRQGRALFYVGIFAAIYSSIIGHAFGLGYMGSHAYLRWTRGKDRDVGDYKSHICYRSIAIWCLLSPLVWTAPGMPGFVTLTLIANSAQVVFVPLLAGGLWWITASPKFIGSKYCNRWWENLVMCFLFALAVWGACNSVLTVYKATFTARQVHVDAQRE